MIMRKRIVIIEDHENHGTENVLPPEKSVCMGGVVNNKKKMFIL